MRPADGLPWRTGRRAGRTIYAQSGPQPSDGDRLIGTMDTPELAEAAVRAHNGEVTGTAWMAVTAADGLIRDTLEALCRQHGLSLESAVVPGEPARNYELADRLGIGHVFGLKEQDEPDH